MPPPLIVDPATLDLNQVIADRAALRETNPQRFEMEQLSAIVLFDPERNLVAGYKDVGADEFWVRGHMPEYPLMPGVILCESAAQLCSYFTVKIGFLHGDFLGFGGMNDVRFRGAVKIGDRLVLVAENTKKNRRQMCFNVQGFVKNAMVFHGEIIGVPLRRDSEAASEEA